MPVILEIVKLLDWIVNTEKLLSFHVDLVALCIPTCDRTRWLSVSISS